MDTLVMLTDSKICRLAYGHRTVGSKVVMLAERRLRGSGLTVRYQWVRPSVARSFTLRVSKEAFNRLIIKPSFREFGSPLFTGQVRYGLLLVSMEVRSFINFD